MNVHEGNPDALDAVAQELSERAAHMRARYPDANHAAKEETALQLAMVLIGEIQGRRHSIPHPTEYYAQRALHLVRWSGSNIGGAVMIEYLIQHSGDDLELYLQRLLEQTGYQDEENLSHEMRAAIERMREEGRDPVESYRRNGNQPRDMGPSATANVPRMEEPASAEWSEMVALVREIEARHLLLQNPEMLIDPLTDRFINALKRHGLPMQHDRDWYRDCIARLMIHHADSLFAGIMLCLLLDNVDARNGRRGRRRISPAPGSSQGNGANGESSRNQKWFS